MNLDICLISLVSYEYFRFRVRNIPSETRFSVDAEVKVCFDATSNKCQTEISVMKASDLLYTVCSPDDDKAPFKGKKKYLF